VPLGTVGYLIGWNVDAVVGEEQIARLFVALGIADEDRNDVGRAQQQPRRRARPWCARLALPA
jgi:hypothetical protein